MDSIKINLIREAHLLICDHFAAASFIARDKFKKFEQDLKMKQFSEQMSQQMS